LYDEAVQLTEALGYGLVAWPAKNGQALIASARGDEQRAMELDAIVNWARPRGFRVVEWYAWHGRGLAALGRGDFEEAYQQFIKISPPGVLASNVQHAARAHGPRGRRGPLVATPRRQPRRRDAGGNVALSSRLALAAVSAMAADDDAALELFRRHWRFPASSAGNSTWRCAWRTANDSGQPGVKDARVRLNAALAMFERLEARPWVDTRSRASSDRTNQTACRY
jgi:hypothetical protein